MAKHVKIKCKNERDYEKARDILGMAAIEYYQKAPDKAIHLCGFDTKKGIEALFESYGLKKIKVKVDEPDFDKVVEDFEEDYER